jgi:hypothetical protein
MSLKGHGEAIRFMKEFNVPMLVTGGERMALFLTRWGGLKRR